MMGPLPPVVACTSSDGKAWRALPTQMDKRTPADDQVPTWVADAALRQLHTASKDSKCAFNLLPERVCTLLTAILTARVTVIGVPELAMEAH
jgi:hypothetical protein